MELTEEDVLEILNLIEESKFDYLQVEVGDLKLTVSKGGDMSMVTGVTGVSGVSGPEKTSVQTPVAAAPAPEPAAAPAAPAAPVEEIDREGLAPVTAPMVGTFYAAPEPEAPPFTELGARVDEDDTVGLIETMKVYTSVRAGVTGTVKHLLVANAQFVEYGQELFLVEPDKS